MRRVCTGLLIAAPLLVAQAAGPTGTDPVLQQTLPGAPAPSPSRSTGLSVNDEMDAHAPPPSASVRVDVKVIKILGNTSIDTATLHALVADALGKSLNLSQLDELAARIRNHYRSRGHPLVRVVTPAQRFYAGIVRILVIEAPQGRTGNDKGIRLNDLLLKELSYDLPPVATASAGESKDLAMEVKALRITGNTSFDEATLHALVADGEGKKLNLAQLDELAGRISSHYRSRGYPYALTVVPAQVVQAGVVHLLVIEARYGKVEINNQTRVDDRLVQATMSPIKPGQPVDQAKLDEALLLLSDTPGVVVNATLKPGKSVGMADLLVEATPGPAYSGNLTLDDYGNSYTGRTRLGGNLYVNNPLRHGDVLSLGGLSAGSGLNYGRIGYDSLLTGRGTRAGASYSSMNYGLGGSLTNLDARGSSETGSLWLRQPLWRRQNANLYGQIQYDAVQLRERIGVAAIQTDRRVNSWTASLTGDSRDTLLSESVNTWSLGWTQGRITFDDASAQAVDAATAKTEGDYSKWNLSLSRLQSLGRDKALYFAFSGQWAGGNLDSSQKVSIGGPYSVRAYEVGALSGDAGYRSSLEFRYDLGQLWQGRFETVVFLDSATVTVNQTPWTTGTNSATLSGAGIGFNWMQQNKWKVRTYIATPIGPKPELVRTPDATRAGSEIGFQF